MIYIAASIQHFEPWYKHIPMPDDDGTWDHPNIQSLFARGTSESDILRDLLFDLTMGRRQESRIRITHQVKEFSTLALGRGAFPGGNGYYVALEAEGGTIFASNAMAFIEEVATLVRGLTKESLVNTSRNRKGK